MAALALAIAGSAAPSLAQDAQSEARLRKVEAEVRALQRKVFPGGDGKFFAPEIAPGAPAAAAPSDPPATTPVTDLLTRMESLEAQVAQLTARIEEASNKIAQLEARSAASAPAQSAAPATSPAPAVAPAPTAAETNLTAMTGGATAAAATPPAASAPAVAAPAPVAAPRLTPASATTSARSAAAPSAQRLAAVRAIAKPQTEDPGDDEYSYGFRLWEAKFFPEAQQQLKLFVERYPKHRRISFGRNLLGRAYLDDGKPREAASWFLQNYQTDRAGARAADSLLYLAVSMRELEDRNRACIALAEFAQTYAAEAAGRLKGDYDSLRSTVKCNR